MKHTVNSEIGPLEFEIQSLSNDPNRFNATFQAIDINPVLPEGMKVNKVTALIIQIITRKELFNLKIVAMLKVNYPIDDNPSPGEDLESQTWVQGEKTVSLGTEDFEALSYRLPFCGFLEKNSPVNYIKNGIEMEIPKIPIGKKPTFHFIVAESDTCDPEDVSTWFAVDVRHEKLLEKLNGN